MWDVGCRFVLRTRPSARARSAIKPYLLLDAFIPATSCGVSCDIFNIQVDIVATMPYFCSMKIFRWNAEKNELLARERGVTFEEIVDRIGSGARVVETDHPNQERYPGQKIMIVDLDGYAYMVPYVRDGDEYFLRTIIPSRKATRNTLEEKMSENDKAVFPDEYETEIVEAFETGRLKPSAQQTDFKTIARNTMKKNRKINIRIAENDLSALQRRAAREGIPYQTLIGSVLHKFANGLLKDSL
jgi:predicted DNA binding CopG/RHH family protein